CVPHLSASAARPTPAIQKALKPPVGKPTRFEKWKNRLRETSKHRSCRQDQKRAPPSATHQQQDRVSEKPRRPATRSGEKASAAKASERHRKMATRSATLAQQGLRSARQAVRVRQSASPH